MRVTALITKEFLKIRVQKTKKAFLLLLLLVLSIIGYCDSGWLLMKMYRFCVEFTTTVIATTLIDNYKNTYEIFSPQKKKCHCPVSTVQRERKRDREDC